MKGIVILLLSISTACSLQAKLGECIPRMFHWSELDGFLDGDPVLISGYQTEWYISVSGWVMIQHKGEDPITELDENNALDLHSLTGDVTAMTLQAAKLQKQIEIDKKIEEYMNSQCKAKGCNED